MEAGKSIYIGEDHYSSPDLYHFPSKFSPYIQGIYASSGQITDRIKKLARDIRQYYGSETITIIVLLRV